MEVSKSVVWAPFHQPKREFKSDDVLFAKLHLNHPVNCRVNLDSDPHRLRFADNEATCRFAWQRQASMASNSSSKFSSSLLRNPTAANSRRSTWRTARSRQKSNSSRIFGRLSIPWNPNDIPRWAQKTLAMLADWTNTISNKFQIIKSPYDTEKVRTNI